MRDVIDEAERFAAIANDTANIGYLLIAAVTALILAALGVVWMRRRINRLPARPQPSRPSAQQSSDPVEDFIEQALRYDRDQKWLRDGERPEGRDR